MEHRNNDDISVEITKISGACYTHSENFIMNIDPSSQPRF